MFRKIAALFFVLALAGAPLGCSSDNGAEKFGKDFGRGIDNLVDKAKKQVE